MPGVNGLNIQQPPLPVHAHTDGASGGDLEKYARLDRTSAQTFASNVDVATLSCDGLVVGNSAYIVASNGDASLLAGSYIHTFTPETATDGRSLYWPDETGPFAIRGGKHPIVTKTANYTATVNVPGTNGDEVILVDATGGARTITLPPAAAITGKMYRVKKIDASANAVTIDGDGAETIDGAATQSLTLRYESLTVISDGSAWWIV